MSSRDSNPGHEKAILEQIEQALRRRLESVVVPEEITGTASVAAPVETWPEQVGACVARAEQQTSAAVGLFEEVSAALAAWRERTASLQRRLAEWPTRAL